MPPTGFEPAIPASELPQTLALDRPARSRSLHPLRSPDPQKTDSKRNALSVLSVFLHYVSAPFHLSFITSSSFTVRCTDYCSWKHSFHSTNLPLPQTSPNWRHWIRKFDLSGRRMYFWSSWMLQREAVTSESDKDPVKKTQFWMHFFYFPSLNQVNGEARSEVLHFTDVQRRMKLAHAFSFINAITWLQTSRSEAVTFYVKRKHKS
jgi:hypothetical protein